MYDMKYVYSCCMIGKTTNGEAKMNCFSLGRLCILKSL